MTEQEIEVVAEELAKIGGTSWYPGREHGPLMRVVSDRYRDRARIAIAALDRLRAGHDIPNFQECAMNINHTADEKPSPSSGDDIQPGATVVYRPAGERRAYPCRIVTIEGSRAYLKPILNACTGWITLERHVPSVREPQSGYDPEDANA